jgi:GTP-binding protein EngB required for normal cell division
MLQKPRALLSSDAFRNLGIPGHATKLRYFQRHSAARQFFPADELAALPRLADKPKTQTQMLMLETYPQAQRRTSTALLEASKSQNDDDDDDVVSERPSTALAVVSASQEVAVPSGEKAETVLMRQAVGPDVIKLVTDEFTEARKVQVERRRKVLYDLTHPNPLDYTYAGKLVPPPPLSFGTVTPEAVQLGRQVLLGQQYSLVRSAPSSDYFFEINDVYQEIVFVGKANAGKSSLINALLGQPELAKTSSSPNSTRMASFYQAATPDELSRYAQGKPSRLVKLPGGGLQLTFVDLPGFGIEGMSDRWRDNAIEVTDSYLGVRRSVNTVFMCMDCERGLTKTDIKYFEWIENLHGMCFVLLTKCDSVPHSRVCSVMRQVYQLITKHRRKFRRVFPFVLPVSAADGTNMDDLRGLIAETSGLIAGDRLREILKIRAEKERGRVEALTNAELKLMWQSARKTVAQVTSGNVVSQSSQAQPSPTSSALLKGKDQVHLSPSVEIDLSSCSPHELQPSASLSGYGGASYRLSTGLRRSEKVDLSSKEGENSKPQIPETRGPEEALPLSPPCASPVKRYVSLLDSFARSQSKWPSNRSEERITRQQLLRGTKVFAEESDGRYRQYQGGAAVGPLLATVNSSARNRRSEWKARQLASLAAKARPDAPWEALEQLRRERAEKERNKLLMRPKDWEAYNKNAGKIIEGFERFENEVTMCKQMNEVRQVKTLRKQQQLHLNATAKIGFRQQPPGLLKDYGGMETYNPITRVLGLQ